MNPITKSSILSFLCLAASVAAQGPELTLRTTAKKGSSVWLLQESKQEQTIDQGGQQFDVGGTTTHTLHVTVLDVDDKGMLVVETEIVRIHGAMQMGPMGEAEFDSAAPDDGDDGGDDMGGMNPSAMVKQMTKLAGKKFVAKLDSMGKATSLEGAADLLKVGGGRMGNPVNEETLKHLAEAAFGIVPEKPIAVGASWDRVEKGTGRIGASNKMKLTLAKCDDASFEITATGTVEKPADDDAAGGEEGDDPMREMMKNMTISNGKVMGTQKVSRQDGFVIEASNTVSMDVDIETPMGAMQMAMKNTVSTKRTTAEAAMPKKAPAKAEPAKTGESERTEPKSGEK
ncbi:MAG: hypothetical protein JNK78_07125 [Planctomycetes bacterium]|nr:hypothetical protein [Planctomycetota bacterium]